MSKQSTIILFLLSAIIFSCSSNLNKKKLIKNDYKNIDYNKIFEHFETTDHPAIEKRVDVELSDDMIKYLNNIDNGAIVMVKSTVDTMGNVIDTEIFKSEPLFDKAAINAVRKYKIKPAKYKGRKVKVYFMIPVKFQ